MKKPTENTTPDKPSTTPRTDAAAMPIDRVNTFASRPCNVVHEDVCRQLERELAEAKFDLQFRRDLYALQSKELAEVRKQRDTLVEALRQVRAICLDKSIETHPDEYTKGTIDDCIDIAESALAAVKGGSHE